MKLPPDCHHRHRFPAELISHAVWLYHVFSLIPRLVNQNPSIRPEQPPSGGCHWAYRFRLMGLGISLRDVELILAERGVVVSYESIRRWCRKFGHRFANSLRRRRPKPGDKWHLDEVFIRIAGKQHYLWRAVDQDGIVLDILVQSRRNAKAAKRFFKKLLRGLQYAPRVT